MLEAIGNGDPNYKGDDWGDKWANSKNAKDRKDEIQKMISERREKAGQNNDKEDDRVYAMPYTTQIRAVVKRSFVAYWRTPEYFIGKLSLHIITGLFNTFTYWKVGNGQIDMQNRLFSIFLTLVIAPPLVQQLQPRFIAFRNIYNSREGNSKIYAWPAFCLGTILPEIPYSLFCGTIYWACWYWGVGFPKGTYISWYVWSLIMLFEVWYIGFGQFIAAIAPNELLASLLVSLPSYCEIKESLIGLGSLLLPLCCLLRGHCCAVPGSTDILETLDVLVCSPSQLCEREVTDQKLGSPRFIIFLK